MVVRTGVPGLDALMKGGIPSNRVIAVSGGPGTGKSTLAMQFLQTGLAESEKCLYISTEQTTDEIRDTFAPYDFDLENDRLTITHLNAVPGNTIERGSEALILDHSDGKSSVEGFRTPFTSEFVCDHLNQYSPCDRVVLDSVSGLASMSDDARVTRRMVLSLIRLFSDRFGATSLLVTEDEGGHSEGIPRGSQALRYNAHGIIDVWSEEINGEHHRFLRITKLRGVDHDTRNKKLLLRPDGIRLEPRRRTRSEKFIEVTHRSTGLPGLDQLTGGGLIGGSTALLEHDGRSSIEPIVVSMITEALVGDEVIVLFPSANMTPERFDRMLPSRVDSVTDLLADDRLFVLDFVGTWKEFDRNVYPLGDQAGARAILSRLIRPVYYRQIKTSTMRINDRRSERPAFAVLHTESLLQHLSPSEIRQMYYWAKQNLLFPDDRVLFVQNPGVMDDKLAEFYAYDAEQILSTWHADGGLQFVSLEKSPGGEIGSSRLVKHLDHAPFVEVERTPRFDPDQLG